MKISIDTKEDSAEDIKRVVRMLQAWVEGHINAPLDMFGSGSPDSSQPAANPGLFNIFNDDKKTDDLNEAIIMDLDRRDDPEDIPPVITY